MSTITEKPITNKELALLEQIAERAGKLYTPAETHLERATRSVQLQDSIEELAAMRVPPPQLADSEDSQL